MNDREARIEELLAKEEIREVIQRVARGTDRRDADLIRSGYHPDAIDDHGFFRLTPSEFAEWMSTRIGHSQHFFGQINIEVKGNVAYSEAYAHGNIVSDPTETMPARDLFHGLRYLDRFEKRDNGPWLIAYRKVIYDFGYYVLAAAKMVAPETAEWGRLDRDDPSYHIAEFPSTKMPWKKIMPPGWLD